MTGGRNAVTIAVMRSFRFSPALTRRPPFTLGDGVVILSLAALLYAGVRISLHAPAVISGPNISLSLLGAPLVHVAFHGECCLRICFPFCSR